MPVMSGVELLALLRDQDRRVPFIFITAFPDERIRARAFSAGALGFLTKPFDQNHLIECLEQALRLDDGNSGR
jgi:FixJ family two-component response regulator